MLKLGIGLVGTLVALVLGLLIATSKSNYDAEGAAVRLIAGNLVLLDRVLASYGPEASSERELVRNAAGALVNQVWPSGEPEAANFSRSQSGAEIEAVYHRLADLSPQDGAQRSLQTWGLQIVNTLAQTRMGMFAQRDNSLPPLFLVVLTIWQAIVFGSFGFVAPSNRTVLIALTVYALSVSCAVFLFLELAQPFEGLIQVSSQPLREAIAQLGR